MNSYTIKSFVVLITCLSSSVNGVFTDVPMMSSLGTALPSKQEKYLITYLHAWSIAMEHAQITKSDAKLSEIYEQNEWHLFPGNVIYDF